jgi:hypothetical protein
VIFQVCLQQENGLEDEDELRQSVVILLAKQGLKNLVVQDTNK